MAVNKYSIVLAVLSLLILALTLVFLFVNHGSSENVNAKPSYYIEGPLRTFNYCGERKTVALTFDDGPDIIKTPNVLRELSKLKVKATFYMSPAAGGVPTSGQCALVEKILSEGHSVQSHSWNHLNFANMTNLQVVQNLQINREWLEQCAGSQRRHLNLSQFRPPYGSLAKDQPSFISNLGYTIAGWNIDSKDISGGELKGNPARNGGTKRNVFKKIIEDFRKDVPSDSSAVILMHDKHYDEYGTKGLLSLVVPYFKRLGYQFQTADKCFKGCNEYVTICEDNSVWPRWATL